MKIVSLKNTLFPYPFTVLLALLISSCSSDDNSGSPQEEDLPPASFTLLSPGNNTSGVSLTPVLEWEEAVDPNGDNVVYDIYFNLEGETLSDPYVENHPSNSIGDDSAAPLDYETTYQWKVVAKDPQGNTTESPVYKFTTAGNQAPNAFALVSPANETTTENVSGFLLDWEDVVDPENDAIIYNLLIGDEEDIFYLEASNLTDSQFTITDQLEQYNTIFYWKVLAKDSYGNTTESSVFTFKTPLSPLPRSVRMPFFGSELDFNFLYNSDMLIESISVTENGTVGYTRKFTYDGEGRINGFETEYGGTTTTAEVVYSSDTNFEVYLSNGNPAMDETLNILYDASNQTYYWTDDIGTHATALDSFGNIINHYSYDFTGSTIYEIEKSHDTATDGQEAFFVRQSPLFGFFNNLKTASDGLFLINHFMDKYAPKHYTINFSDGDETYTASNTYNSLELLTSATWTEESNDTPDVIEIIYE
ncbi:MAG: hypothetical protein AB3N16_07405 [Flavobacteriaceae bacterium]